jgi:hypothetical protein
MHIITGVFFAPKKGLTIKVFEGKYAVGQEVDIYAGITYIGTYTIKQTRSKNTYISYDNPQFITLKDLGYKDVGTTIVEGMSIRPANQIKNKFIKYFVSYVYKTDWMLETLFGNDFFIMDESIQDERLINHLTEMITDRISKERTSKCLMVTILFYNKK